MTVLEHIFITPTEDQGKGLDEAVEFGKSKEWQLVSVIWKDLNPAGHHRFIIAYLGHLPAEIPEATEEVE
jgi:hypothetical protein